MWKICFSLVTGRRQIEASELQFFFEKVKYMGDVVRPDTLEVDVARISALKRVGYPQTKAQLKRVLGF